MSNIYWVRRLFTCGFSEIRCNFICQSEDSALPWVTINMRASGVDLSANEQPIDCDTGLVAVRCIDKVETKWVEDNED